MDTVLDKTLREGVPITRENYILWAYWDRKLEDLQAEELAMLPGWFFDLPKDEREIN
jgi:hypothetical protein